MEALASLGPEHFERLQGLSFHLSAGDAPGWTARLTQVQRLPHPAPGLRAGFALLFKGPPGAVWPQQIYRVQPEDGGEPLELFLVPVGADAAGVDYEAVFG